jgi:hypothetical protein
VNREFVRTLPFKSRPPDEHCGRKWAATVVEFLRKHQQQQERNLVRMKLNFGTIDLTSRKAGSARNAPPGLFAAASRW